MTYNYTDKQLNELNQGKDVYSVSEIFSKNNDTKTVVSNADINSKNETNTLTVGDQQFQVIVTKVDPKTGIDGMAVAPIVNGTPNLFLTIMKMLIIFSIMEIRRLK